MFLHPFRHVAIFIVFTGVAAFFVWHLIRFFSPPDLIVEGGDIQITRESQLVFRGRLAPESTLTINDGTVYINSTDGRFETLVALRRGVNEFVFTGKNRLGRTSTVVRRVFKE